MIVTNVLESVTCWGYFIGSAAWEGGESGEGMACPSLYRREREHCDDAPGYGAGSSYWYSPAFVTDWELWRDNDEARRQRPDDHRRLVGVHDVTYPCAKVVMFEPEDFHADGGRLDAPRESPGMLSNAGFADGHAVRVRVDDAQPALRVTWPVMTGPRFSLIPGASLPFCSSRDGYRGRDF